jgi:hypothetical protein
MVILKHFFYSINSAQNMSNGNSYVGLCQQIPTILKQVKNILAASEKNFM